MRNRITTKSLSLLVTVVISVFLLGSIDHSFDRSTRMMAAAPSVTSLSPSSATAGGSAFTLAVNGVSFVSDFVIRTNGIDRTTTFVNSAALITQIAASEIATAGTLSVTVFDPAPTGGESTPLIFTINNPMPTTSSLSPASATASGAGFTLTVNGANFVSGATVNFGGTSHTATIVNSGRVTALIAASEITTAATIPVTVTNPTPGGGASTPALTFTINNPLPATTTLSPASVTAGGAVFTLTVNGSNFASGATINFGAVNHSATFVNSGQLTASIATAEITTAGTVNVTVTNPAPGGGTSTSALILAVNNPAPTVTALSPTSKTAGDPAFTLTVNGNNFNSSSVVRFNGSARSTTLVSSTQLTAQITAADVSTAGTYPITVFNPAPAGGLSSAVNLTVNNPAPTTVSLSPTTVSASGSSFTLTVNGTNFNSTSIVQFNGVARATTLVNTTKLTATILAADIATTGTFPITVFNPAPGGGTSNAVGLTVNPSVTTISPTTVRAGGVGFTLTVNGTGFAAGSVVRFNGVNRTTTFFNTTQLSASILATDITGVGTFPITVLNPGSLTSNAVNVTVTPSISNLTPVTAVVGDPAFTLTVNGTGFVSGSVVKWNGSNRTTTFVNSTKLTAAIAAADIATIGSFPVTVSTPAPTSLTSNTIKFSVTNPPPATECAVGADVTLANPGLINSGPARAQMWRNDNTWWSVFSNNIDGLYIYKQTSPTTWVQGALIDTNIVVGTFVAGAPDVLWNGTNLFVLIQESTLMAKLYKYTYDSGTQTYLVVSGFPVSLSLIGVGTSGSGKPYGTLAIDQDSTGKLWAAYSGAGVGGDGNVRVISSTSADHKTWDTTGVILASGVSTLNTEGTTILHFGSKIGVAWSNQITFEQSFRFHNDGNATATWSSKELIDSGLGPEGTGSVAGKQMTMKAASDGRIFFVCDDNDGANNHLHLYIRTTGGTWGQKTLVVNSFTAMPSKPVLLLDTDNGEVHVIYKDNSVGSNGLSGQTFITQASMTNPAFNTPCLLIDTSDGTLSTSNPTSTKQNLTATTDLVVAASTGRKGNQILVNTVDLTPNVLTIFGFSPKEVTAGENTLTLTINGKLFVKGPPSSIVRRSGVNKTTTFINAGKLTASLPASDMAAAGSYPITVLNPDGSVSNAVSFVVTATNPVPAATTIFPNRELVGSPSFTMTVSGAGFRRSSVVKFNGSNRTTTFVSDTQLTATILASDLLVAGPYPITVTNPTPGGGTSTVTKRNTFFVEPPCAPSSPQTLSGITVFNTNKAQMWYNDGLWWGAFSDNLAGVFFYKQSGATFAKLTQIDGNLNGRPDVLWNGNDLFVLVYEFNTQAKLYKYSYNSTTKAYTIVSGFPVTLPLIGIGTGTTQAQTGSVTMAQDSAGKLWAAYPGTGPGGDRNYRVIWSTSADQKTWDTNGFILATGGATVTQEVMSIVPFQGNKTGVTWSNQVAVELGFRYHNDGDPENVWSTKEVIDFGLGNEIGIGGVADNHESIKAAPDGRIFLVQKDSDGSGNLHLYIRSTAGVWTANPILIDIDPQAQPTRPTVLLDLENSEVYVLYEDATQSLMYLSHTSIDTPVFGPACPYVTQTFIANITSTKQNLTAGMGLMAAGSTGGAASEIYSNPVTLAAGSGNVPTLTSISPSSAGAAVGPFTLTINGSNFSNSAVVYFNGSDRPTTFLNSTQLAATIFATDIPKVGTYPVTVMNPRGGTAAALNLTVNPSIASLAPPDATAGNPAFTLTVNGIGFANGAVTRFNGIDRTTTFVSSAQLTAQITAADIQAAGNLPVTVINPGGSTSAPSNFTINNPVPALATISPASVVAGGGAFTLNVNGSNFNSSSVVNFDGVARATTFVSGTQLTTQLTAADVAGAGNYLITVFNPVPGGGTSAASTLTVNNPLPTLTSIAPTSKIAGDIAFVLTANGTNFNNSSVVQFNGTARTTTLVNASQVTAQITAADVATAGTPAITVFNPAPGGGTSAASTLTVNNPLPTLTSITPSSKIAGDIAFVLTVNGTSFNSSSVVQFNGSARTTTFVNATQLTAQLTAADVATAGTPAITVFNPAPGGGTSAASTLTVNNPLPALTSIAPTSKIAGDIASVLTVNGTNFNNSSVVQFNGTARTTTFVNASQVTAQITATDVATAGTPSITVFNPAPGGGTSAASTLTVNNPLPTLTSIAPTSKTAGDAAFVLTVNGTNFNSSSVVQFNGTARSTTFVNASQVTAQILAADVVTAGSANITLINPTPGGGTSNAVNLTVNNPLPTVTALSPSTTLDGSPSFTLTVNGSNFVSSSVVQWNGQPRATSFVSSTQLTAQITAADIATAGTVNVLVNTPAPGGGTSGTLTFQITNNARSVRVVNSSGSANTTVTVPIQLTAQGDENTLGFGLDFDTSLLSNPTATLGSDAAGASLNLNTTQVAQGHFGIALSLPTGQSFVAGTRNTVNVNFTTAAVAIQTTAPLAFGDQPIARQALSSSAAILPIIYIGGTVTITLGYEADVLPRPNGSNNGTVSIGDWAEIGRFAAGFDTVNLGSEFQRADCAPKSTSGNGSVTVADWAQAGRYASGLDPVQAAGGPTAPPSGLTAENAALANRPEAADLGDTPRTTVRLTGTPLPAGQPSSLSIDFQALGYENAFGFSLMFDPAKLKFLAAEKSGEASLATLNVNKLEAADGRLGIAIALPAGKSFSAGAHQLVVLTFTALGDVYDTPAIGFTDRPIAREVVDVNANSLLASFKDTSTPGVNPIDDLQFFVVQHYLDFLNRTPDSSGLDYWTQQLKQCGNDAACLRQRRIDVSAAFFIEQEFQQTGYVVYRLYRAAYAQRPSYAQFVADRGLLLGGPQLPASTLEFANQFVSRAEFKLAYPDSLTPNDFVNRLFQSAALAPDPAKRQQAIQALTAGTKSRAQVLLELSDSQEFKDREYNPAFVLMQYFGYLKRDPDQAGYDFWLNLLNNNQTANYRGMVCAFISSREYQQRFSPVVTHTDQDCGPWVRVGFQTSHTEEKAEKESFWPRHYSDSLLDSSMKYAKKANSVK